MSNSIKAFQEEIQGKIRRLLQEFGEGQLSREQFNILYERYNNQLELALTAGETAAQQAKKNDLSTIAIREATTGKAIGLAVYHHRSGTIIETLGHFELGPDIITPVLHDFSDKMESRQFIEPVTQKLSAGHWVLYMARHFTTAIVIFRNEPSPRQIRALERLLHDFEEANQRNLDTNHVDASKLAVPFVGFVRKKLRS